jgi:hypothetical protein
MFAPSHYEWSLRATLLTKVNIATVANEIQTNATHNLDVTPSRESQSGKSKFVGTRTGIMRDLCVPVTRSPMGACHAVGFVVYCSGVFQFKSSMFLNWGSQVQQWPLPVLIGSTYDWISRTVLGMMYEMTTHNVRHNINVGFLQESGNHPTRES